MAKIILRERTKTTAAVCVSAVLLLAAIPAAQGQIIFNVELPRETAQKIVTAEKPIDNETLTKLLRESRLTYKGEEPVKAHLVVALVGKEGEVHKRRASEPFTIKPGTYPADRFLSKVKVQPEPAEERLRYQLADALDGKDPAALTVNKLEKNEQVQLRQQTILKNRGLNDTKQMEVQGRLKSRQVRLQNVPDGMLLKNDTLKKTVKIIIKLVPVNKSLRNRIRINPMGLKLRSVNR